MVRVSVVIPTWDALGLVQSALRSLEAQTWADFEVVVVDNGSSDGTPAALRDRFPDVRLVRFERNRGFAVAVNAGIREARGEIIVLMNNDVEAEPGWIEALVSALDRHPEAGSCASKILDFHERARVDSAGDQVGYHASSVGHGQLDGPDFSAEREVFSACAAAAAYRCSLFDDVGVFDRRFFAYLEDVDLGFRAQLAGYRCVFVPDAVVYHHGGASSKRLSDARMLWLSRNALFLFFQNMPLRIIARYGWYHLSFPALEALRGTLPARIAVRAYLEFMVALPVVCAKWARRRARRRIGAERLQEILLPPVGSAASRGPRTAAGRGLAGTEDGVRGGRA